MRLASLDLLLSSLRRRRESIF